MSSRLTCLPPINDVIGTLHLETGGASLEIAPALGASVLRYTLSNGCEVFRPAPQECTDPFAAGCFMTAPWCNRIAGGVTLDGTRIPIARNREDQALPIHGSAAASCFDVVEASGTRAHLSARITGPDPFDFMAEVIYTLEGCALTVSLTLTHAGDGVVPYGLGLHPWFPRRGLVELQARASHYYQTDADMLPTGRAPVAGNPAWDFNEGRALPADLIDTGFNGWDGHARLQGDDGWAMDVRTEPPCGCYQVYSPGAEAGFFCFEPVTHPIDAHNNPALPGLAALSRGQSVTLTTQFIPV